MDYKRAGWFCICVRERARVFALFFHLFVSILFFVFFKWFFLFAFTFEKETPYEPNFYVASMVEKRWKNNAARQNLPVHRKPNCVN